MATDPAKTLRQIKNLYEALDDLHAREQAIHDEIRTLLGGGVGMGERMKALEACFQACWAGRYGGGYLFHQTKDKPLMKRLLRTFTDDDLAARIVSYLGNEDPFFVRSRHSFALFSASINSHAGSITPTEPQVSHCTHYPPCKDDIAHTRRNREELYLTGNREAVQKMFDTRETR